MYILMVHLRFKYLIYKGLFMIDTNFNDYSTIRYTDPGFGGAGGGGGADRNWIV